MKIAQLKKMGICKKLDQLQKHSKFKESTNVNEIAANLPYKLLKSTFSRAPCQKD